MQLIIAVLLISCTAVQAQQAEPVLPYSIEQHPVSWYKEQAEAWEQLTRLQPHNAIAWYNLYYAHRLLSSQDPDDKRSEETRQNEMNVLLKKIEKNIPGTYEYNLIKWLSGGLDFAYLSYLQKADELGPDRTEHLSHMMNVAELKGNIKDRDAYATRQYNSGIVSSGMLYYNYNTLSGLDSNAILLTEGDNDTYPAWTLQSLGIRRDVKVLNISLLLVDEYREAVCKSLGVDFVKIDWNKEPENVERNFQKAVIGLFARNKKGYPVYVSLTASYIAGIAEPNIDDKLYLTGLAYKYSDKPIDNIAILRRNFEKVYKLDYLDNPFYKDRSAALVRRINTNYVVPMTKLKEHYATSGDISNRNKMKLLLSFITKDENGVQKQYQ